MPLLEAFLALALTMLSLAMVATLVVEFFHRLARTRAKDLKVMLEELYDSELKELARAELQKTGAELKKHKDGFIQRLSGNPLIQQGVSGRSGLIKSRLKDLETLSAADFFKRLAETEIGKKIKEKAEREIDEIVESLSLAYDRYCVVATDLFKRRAQVVSLVAGVLVAFGLNVNALVLFRSYLDDPQLRAKALVQAEAVAERFEQRVDNSGQGFKDLDEAKELAASIQEEIASLDKLGVPMGYSWDEAPWKALAEQGLVPQEAAGLLWALGVLGTGLLIGLGGPFWFDVVRKLTAVLHAVRGGAPTEPGRADSAAPPAEPARSNKDIFKMTGGAPPAVKDRAHQSAAARAAMEADKAVKAAADALTGARQAASDPADDRAMAAVAVAEDAFVMAANAQRATLAARRIALADAAQPA